MINIYINHIITSKYRFATGVINKTIGVINNVLVTVSSLLTYRNQIFYWGCNIWKNGRS